MSKIETSQNTANLENVITLDAREANYVITELDVSSVGTTAEATIRVNGNLAKNYEITSGGTVTKSVSISVRKGMRAEIRVQTKEDLPPPGYELYVSVSFEYADFLGRKEDLSMEFQMNTVPTDEVGLIPPTPEGTTPNAGFYITE